MNNKKFLTIVSCILVLTMLLGMLSGCSEPNYAARLSKAQQYLDQNDFEHAILEYQAAISMERTKAPAYIGLSNAYYRQGMTSLARQTLEEALSLVSDPTELTHHLAVLFPNKTLSISRTGNDGGIVDYGIAESSADPVLNLQLLQFVASANYNDYLNKYDNPSSEWTDNKCIVRIKELAADLYFYDTSTLIQINSNTKKPYPECIPNEIRFDNVAVLFGGVSKITYYQLQNMTGITELREENGRLTFMSYGCALSVACDADSAILAYADNALVPSGGVMQTGTRQLYGKVLDATTGNGVSDAELTVGKDTYGAAQQTVRTDYSGNYTVDLDAGGSYIIKIKKNGYIEESFSIYIPDGAKSYPQDFTISPSMSGEEIRLVLTWGASPTDLDSYLIGKASDGTPICVYFGSPTAMDSSGHVAADLDVDDVSSYGPETITLHDVNGSYEYYIDDFTRSTGIGTSGATVKIYQGNALIATVTPSASIGFGWSVCRIENGVVTVTNQAMNP